ncbi:MAG: hypothetical protein PVI30_17585 [Myxococcales bacterium]|jgi:hypothetical protein
MPFIDARPARVNALSFRLLMWSVLCCAVQAGCAPVAAEPAPGDSPNAQAGPSGDASAMDAARHPTTIAIPSSLKGVVTGDISPSGQPVVVACETCHRLPDVTAPTLPARPNAIRGPHAGLQVRHGDIRCGSCHDPADRARLRRADGTSLPLTRAIELCSQCHGTQRRDYDHGAHGGMNGYWDLSRGPRVRNHCVHCHDPHAPAFPKLIPAPPPRDRFFGEDGSHD